MVQNVTLLDGYKVRIENLKNIDIAGRNFKGLGPRDFHQYDKEGVPYFNVRLTKESYDILQQDGWDVWCSPNKSQDPDAEDRYGLKVTIDTNGFRKSHIIMASDKGSNGRRRGTRIDLDLVTLGELDNYIFGDIEVVIRPWTHKSGRNAGMKAAYLDTMIFTLAKPDLTDEWSDLDMGDTSDMGDDEDEVPFE